MYWVARPRTSTAKKKAERPEGMLSKITLKNIQAHEDLTLEFGPGRNVIHGSSDSGKTAVLRGLLWTAINDGIGDTAYVIDELNRDRYPFMRNPVHLPVAAP